MSKKIISPILYAVLLIPLFIVVMIITAIIDRNIGLRMTGFIEIPILIVVLGTILFWYGSKAIAGFEEIKTPDILDHLRQSSLYYFYALYTGISFILFGYYGGLAEAYKLVALTMAVWAIIVNGIYLYKGRKANIR